MNRQELKNLLKNNSEVYFTNPNSGESVSFSTDEVRKVIGELEYALERADHEKEYLIISKKGQSKVSYNQSPFQGYYNGVLIFGGENGFFSEKIEDILAITPIEEINS